MLNSSGKDCKPPSDETENRSSVAAEDLGQLLIFSWSPSLLKASCRLGHPPPVSPWLLLEPEDVSGSVFAGRNVTGSSMP